MTPVLHMVEANRARKEYDDLISSLRRTTLIKSGVAIVVALVIVSHTSKVRRLNDLLFQFGTQHSMLEQQSTAFGFIANHLEQRSYVLRASESARQLQAMLEVSGSVLGRSITLDTYGRRSVVDVLELAHERPSGITVTLPYFGAAELPLPYWLASIGAAIILLLANAFALAKGRSVGAIRRYCAAHLEAAHSGGDDSVPLRTEFQFDTQSNTRSTSSVKWREVVAILSGVGVDHPADAPPVDLLEIVAGAINCVATVLFCYFFSYLAMESRLPISYTHFAPLPLLPVAFFISLVLARAAEAIVSKLV